MHSPFIYLLANNRTKQAFQYFSLTFCSSKSKCVRFGCLLIWSIKRGSLKIPESLFIAKNNKMITYSPEIGNFIFPVKITNNFKGYLIIS